MYKKLLTALLINSATLILAQKSLPPPLEFGKISPAEIAMTVCPYDSSAAVVVLCEYGLENGDFVMHRRLKILKKEGLEVGNISMAYSESDTKDIDIENAATYNFDNGIMTKTKLKKENIFEEKITKKQYRKKPVFPNLKVGSIFEYEVKYKRIYYKTFYKWTFQDKYPTIWSEYRFANPQNKDFVIFNTIPKYHIYESHDEYLEYRNAVVTRWVQKDMPAAIKEQYSSRFDDYVSSVSLQSRKINFLGSSEPREFNDWKTLAEMLATNDYYGELLKPTKYTKAVLKELFTEGEFLEPKERVAKIYNWVQKYLEWNEYFNFLSSDENKKIFEKKKGHSSEINLALIALLRQAGVTAHPIVLETRSSGNLNHSVPNILKIDHTIAAVIIDKDTTLLDAIDRFLPSGTLSEEALNGFGYFMDFEKKEYKWIPLKNSGKSIRYRVINVNIDSEGVLTGDFERSAKGYTAVDARKYITLNSKEDYVKEGFKTFLGRGSSSNIKIENLTDINAVLKINFDFKTPDFVEKNGDLIYISPMMSLGVGTTPFTLKERIYPIDFGYLNDDQTSYTFNIPTGYKIEDLPKSSRLLCAQEGIKYDFLVTQTENQIKITTKLSIKRGIFSQSEYQDIRTFYDKIINKEAEQIILKKIQ
jgi:hypothetical protein